MKHLYFISLLLIPLFATAQAPAKNIYVELGGAGGFISANYDARLSKSTSGPGFRAGIGLLFDAYSVGYTLPVGLNYLIGGNGNFLELGAGVSYVHFNEKNQDSWFDFAKENFLATNVYGGYRYQPLQKKFVFRAGLCYFISDINLPKILGARGLYPALSFGYSIRH